MKITFREFTRVKYGDPAFWGLCWCMFCLCFSLYSLNAIGIVGNVVVIGMLMISRYVYLLRQKWIKAQIDAQYQLLENMQQIHGQMEAAVKAPPPPELSAEERQKHEAGVLAIKEKYPWIKQA